MPVVKPSVGVRLDDKVSTVVAPSSADSEFGGRLDTSLMACFGSVPLLKNA